MMTSHRVYHEKQVAGLCGVHCLNNLLQGPYFDAVILMQIAREFDEKEREAMSEMGTETPEFLKYMAEDSGNVADDGNYSIQVLSQALKTFSLSCVHVTNPETTDSEAEKAFICHLANHWFTIRKIGNDWYNFDSLLDSPSYLSPFYLSSFLSTLFAGGYSIFSIHGQLPAPEASWGDNWVEVSPHKKKLKQFHQQQEDDDLQAAIEASLLDPSNLFPCYHPLPKH